MCGLKLSTSAFEVGFNKRMAKLPNSEVVKKFLAAQYAGDIDAAFDNYASPSFTWVTGSSNNDELKAQIPWAGYTHHGKEGYKKLTSMLYGEFESLKFETKRFTEGGERVFVEGNFVFKHLNTGKVVDSDFLAVFELVDGRITGGQFYENTAGVAAARMKSTE